MSDSVKSTRNSVQSTPKFGTTNQAIQERLITINSVLTGCRPTPAKSEKDVRITTWETSLLAEGGCNYVWLITNVAASHDQAGKHVSSSRKVVISEPKEEASPCQLINELAFLTYIAKYCPSIPVPELYSYNINTAGPDSPYIAMEFIDGEPLDATWGKLSERSKETITDDIAQIILEMGAIDLGGIGSLTLEHKLGPTVEGVKLFRGREKFHSHDCYDIGPYQTTHDYVIACYEKEIHYYTNAPNQDLDDDVFEDMPRERFVSNLQTTRDALIKDPTPFLPQEPFALVHGDFCGRNIMVHGGHVKAVLDWEFAGSYPLSELLGGDGIEMFELENENLMEHRQWSDIIRDKVVERAEDRGWDDAKIDLLVGEGNRDLQLARREMIPMGGQSDDEGSVKGDGHVGATEDVGIDVDTLAIREDNTDDKSSHLD